MEENKLKALEAAMASIEKKFGKGSIQRLGDTNILDVEAISTGSIKLDKALGIGGLPEGRIIEIYGPESSGKTTLTLHAIAEAQKKGKICAFVDAEHALDPVYAKKLGVDIQQLLVSQPDNGEQALEIVDELTRSGVVNLIVIDSVAALTPKAEIEGDMGDSHMGLQARLMSQGLRKVTGFAKQNNVTLIFINQLRMKIGVMFGCFHYNARVLLADGTTEKIGKLVNQRREVEVLSYNDSTGKLESQPIQDWYNNGKAKQFWNLKVQKPFDNGVSYLPIGDDHLIPTPEGEKRFLDLKIGDEVYSHHDKYLSKEQMDFCVGSILGDGSIRSKNGITAQMRFGHGVKQNEYCKWKMNVFNKSFIGYKGVTNKGEFRFDTKYTHELMILNNKISIVDKWHVPQEVVDLITPLSLAIWYLDDGSFEGHYQKWGNGKSFISAKSMTVDTLERIAKHLENFGLKATVYNQAQRGLYFYGEENFKMHQLIAKYVPKCMEHKIHPSLRNGEKHIFDTTNKPEKHLVPVKILDIYKKPMTNSRALNKFDIEIKDNHNYFVDGTLVHNSPETTTGGNALKFYASVRLDIRRTGSIKNGDEVVANEVKIKVVKNKVAPPFKEVITSIEFGKGFNPYREVLDLAVDYDFVKKAGAWYSDNITSDKIGQGAEKAIDYLKTNKEYYEKLVEKVRAKLKEDNSVSLGTSEDVEEEFNEDEE